MFSDSRLAYYMAAFSEEVCIYLEIIAEIIEKYNLLSTCFFTKMGMQNANLANNVL